MPELPEVETVARGLQRQIAGRRILSITLGKTDFIDNPEQIEKELPGRAIRGVVRYGKFLLLRLAQKDDAGETERESALLVHLGMTGMLAAACGGTAGETYACGCATGRWARIAVHRPAAIWQDGVSCGRIVAGGVAAIRRGSAGSGAGGVHGENPWKACKNQGAVAGSAGFARRGKHLRR